MDYGWPGNVRELETYRARSRASAAQPSALISSPTTSWDAAPITSMLEGRADASLFEIWKSASAASSWTCWRSATGTKTEAADRFRVPLSTLNQKIKRLNIEIRKRMGTARES